MATINVEEVLKKLHNLDKIALLAGVDFWHTKALPEHGIPSLRLSDGPNGVRGTRFFNGITAACFPCGTALGATWDPELLQEAGVVMGKESIAKGAHVILGPTINMQRSPLGGRGFESLSEDPVVAGLGAAALVRGIQETGVVATIKHFVCNDQEHERNTYDAQITERALRELYLLPFQLVVRDSQPGAFMTAYNRVNGTHVSENAKILKDTLRGEWGWKGAVMSDWFGTYSTSEAANAGLDLEMPGPTKWRGEMLMQAVGIGKVPQHILDERARAMLELINRCAASGIPENAKEKTADTPETAALLRKISGDSIVLMKNEGSILPLSKEKKTLVIGPNAKIATYHGGGSASLAAYYAVTPFDGISAKLKDSPDYTVGCYAHKELPLLGIGLKTNSGETGVSFRAYNEPPSTSNRELADEITLTKTDFLLVDYKCDKLKQALWYADIEGTYTAEADGDFELGLCVYGTAKLFVDGKLVVDNETKQTQGTSFFNCGTVEEKGTIFMKKGQDYQIKVEFASAPACKLPQGNNVLFGGGAVRIGGARVVNAEAEVKHAAALAKDADQVIICAGLNSDWEGEGSDRTTMALPGHMDALIEAVVSANPSTVVCMQSGTPVGMPWASKVSGLIHAWYGGNETGNAIADVLFGDVNPSAKLPLTFPVREEDNPAYLNYRSERGRTLYGEDVYMGYRHYETIKLPVLFPFGHGLSYTIFAPSDLKVLKSDNEIQLTLNLKNTGSVAGAEVLQAYVSQKNPSIRRPRKELKGFKKVFLKAGESAEVKIDLPLKYAASFWDEVRDAWVVEKDSFEVLVAGSSEIKDGQGVKGTFEVDETFWWNGL
ncbi:beta-glucosidase [Phlyctema vagabunda]|uniref:Probable beta-glucosidase I n=1 Tax=Phlyctema vagabunda TaxID=108571 RepID=A0ABR4PHP2_9HELO